MNIEELNSGFDSMIPTKEQKDRIFAGVMNAKKQTVKVVKFNKYRYMSAAAAVIAVGVFAAVYSTRNPNDVVPHVTAPSVVAENQNDKIAVNNEKADNAVNDEVMQKSLPQPASVENINVSGSQNTVSTEQTNETKTMTEQFKEAYPELATDNTEATNVVAVNEDVGASRMAPAPTDVAEANVMEDTLETYSGDELVDEESTPTVESSEEDLNVQVDDVPLEDTTVDVPTTPGSGGGGGAASSGGSYTYSESTVLGINDVMNHSVYGSLMPVMYADKFNFHTASEQSNRLKVIFKNEQGNYMTVSIVKDGEHTFYEEVINPEEIKNINPDGYINFAVKCSEYFLIYNVETYDVSAVYDMVMSSVYFNN